MSVLIDIVDDALQVIIGDNCRDDEPNDFLLMLEETFVFTMGPQSSKSTAKKYSCNKEGDLFVTFDKNHFR
jgi:hypothetical protein